MKRRSKTFFIIPAILLITSLFLLTNNSFALNITGSETITTNSNTTYTVVDCNGIVSWGATGTNASINSNGILNAGPASCGAITVTASCSDGSVATKTARVANAGQWVFIGGCWYPWIGYSYRIDEFIGNYIYSGAWSSFTYHLCELGPEKTWEETIPSSYTNFVCEGEKIWPDPNRGWWILNYSTGVWCQWDFLIQYVVQEWQCPPCTNGQTISCTSTDCPNGGVQTCANSQWGACQCANPCTEGGLQNCPCSADAPLFSSANIVSGNLSHDQDLFTASSGVGLSMMLYYDSLNTYTGPVGKKWTHTYDIKLITMSDGSIILAEGNGHGRRYTKSGNSYISQAGDYSILTKNNDNTYVITHTDNTKYNFNANGKITSIVDRNNNAVTFTYANNNLTAVTDSVGRSIALSYNADNRISIIIDPNGNTHSFTYNSNTLVNVSTQILQLETRNWSYTYDQDFFMLTKTDPNNNMTTYAYDTNHRVVKAVNPEGQIKAVSYQPSANSAIITETDGGIWTYKYDTQLGVLLQKIDPNGNTTTYTYDQNKNMLSEIYPDGTYTTYTYDSYGNMTSLTDPLGNTTTYTYNNYGQATSMTDPQGNITRYVYDQKGNLISMTDATGAATQYQFDSKGNVIGITNANGQTTTLSYDQYNNISSMTDAAGATTRFTYNAAGNMISQTDSQGNITRFEYNNLNQLIKITDSQNNITTYTYDKNGNKIFQTDANGNTTYYEYNYKNQITKITDSLGGITVYAYGGTGCGSCGSGGLDKLTSITDAQGNKTTYEYNSLGKLIRETDPLGNITSYSYDSKGNLISKTDANGNTIQYTYDALSRLTQKTYPNGSAEAFQYDSKGNITYAGNQYIAYSFAYDANGKITGVRDSNNRTILYQYDMLGNKTKMQILNPNNQILNTTNYIYNPLNLLTSLSTTINSHLLTFNFAYDSLGRRTKLLYPTGANANYIYDSAGRLTSLTHKTSKGHTIDKYKYTLDKVGNRLTKSSIDTEYTYKYDATYQLLQSIPATKHHRDAETFAYDPVGNRLAGPNDNLTYNYNQNNQLLEKTKERKHDDENVEYTYDKNGNLIKQIEHEHEGKHTKTTLYTYDYENRLIKVETQKHHWQQTVTFAYDPFGRRVSKTIEREKEFEENDHHKEHDKGYDKDDDDHSAIKTTYYVYDNQDILAEYDANGKIKAKYIHGSGIDEHLAVQKKGETYFYHADGLGSIVVLTNSKQHVVQSYSYSSFGVVKREGKKIRQPYMFTGREWDEEIGLYYLRARYFDPLTGRFRTKDPIGFNGGDINLYRYVSNNPINFVDPLGLQTQAISWQYIAPALPVVAPLVINPVAVGVGVGLAVVLWPSTFADSKEKECRKKSRWTCIATCHETPYGGVSSNQRIISNIGAGPTQSEACRDAISNCQASAARGTYTRHCQCPQCWQR